MPDYSDFDFLVRYVIDTPNKAVQDPKFVDAANLKTGLHGESLIHYLAIENEREAIKTLLGVSLDPDRRNRFGQTALMDSSKLGLVEIVDILLRAGADPNIQDAEGNTALHHAYSFGASKNLIQMLVDAGTDMKRRNTYGEVPHEA